MKKISVCLILSLVILSTASADSTKIKGTLRPDPLWQDGRYQILNKSGNQKGWIKKDPLWNDGRYQIFNKKGKQTGIIKPDVIRRDSWIIEKRK